MAELFQLLASLLAVIAVQADRPDVQEPVLVLASNRELVALLPLGSLSRQSDTAEASLVLVYETPEESWELARRQHAVQVDCKGRKLRITKTVKYDRLDNVTGEQVSSGAWEAVGSYPPFSRLVAVACDGDQGSFEKLDGLETAIAQAREALDRK